MIQADILHTFHLGVGRDLVGSVIKILASSRTYWPGSKIEHRLSFATRRLQQWARLRKLSLTLSKLSKQSLGWASDKQYGCAKNIFFMLDINQFCFDFETILQNIHVKLWLGTQSCIAKASTLELCVAGYAMS